MEALYYPNKNLYLPDAFFKRGDVKTKKDWFAILPESVQCKFDEWFTKS